LGKHLITFDSHRFIQDLWSVLEEVLKVEKENILMDIMDNLNVIHFRSDKVRLAGGVETSDRERAILLKKSIEAEIEKEASYQLKLTVYAMRKYFKDSFIGWYYEHGTGELWDGHKGLGYVSHQDRFGKEIVTRSKYRSYIAGGVGVWIDQGGNRRITKSPRAGDVIKESKKGLNFDTPAYHWFSNAFDKQVIKQDLREKFSYVLKHNMKLSNYIKLSKEFVIGRD